MNVEWRHLGADACPEGSLNGDVNRRKAGVARPAIGPAGVDTSGAPEGHASRRSSGRGGTRTLPLTYIISATRRDPINPPTTRAASLLASGRGQAGLCIRNISRASRQATASDTPPASAAR